MVQRFANTIGGLLAAVAAMALAPPTAAQDAFPQRSVRIIVPFPAGSALDGITRLVAENLNRTWGGKGVIVENVAGGGGNIGTLRSRDPNLMAIRCFPHRPVPMH